MIRGIDHLVVACPDPDAAASQLESALGVAATGGGRHAGRGSWNRIAWFADGSYLELIGIDDADRARQSPVGAAAVRALEEHGGGLATYALRADELEATAAGLRAAGSSLGPVVHGSRTRDDGEVVEWWTAFPDTDLRPAAPPFLIEHAYAGAEWGPEALAARADFRHPIGSPVILARLDIAANDPPSTAADLNRELGLDLWAVADLAVADVGPHVLRLVPRREMPVPAVVTIGAQVDGPRTADLVGLRFDVERIEFPAPAERRP
jgi:Glyoxalase-like domain